MEVAKIGFVLMELKPQFEEQWFNEPRQPGAPDPYITELYDRLEASPHIMDIEPSREQLLKNMENEEQISDITYYRGTLTFDDYIRLRIVLPRRKREELFGYMTWSWCPEEFTIYFNGVQFLVHAQVDSAPIITDIGQVAREFLTETLKTSDKWEHIEGIGPTPIHPEIYMVRAVKKEPSDGKEHSLRYVNYENGDLVMIAETDDLIQQTMPVIFRDMDSFLRMFYVARMEAKDHYEAIDDLEDTNSDLNSLLSAYFKLPIYRRLFSKTPSLIRQTLAKMHSQLQDVSSCETDLRVAIKDAKRYLNEANVFSKAEEYFVEHLEKDRLFNRDSQLTVMNFAADETNSLATAQATFIAAMIGAIIGSLAMLGGQIISGP